MKNLIKLNKIPLTPFMVRQAHQPNGIYQSLITDYRLRISSLRMLGLIIAIFLTATSFALTTIQVTTNVLAENVPRLGINLANNYYSSPLNKRLDSKNFEGIRYRHANRGMLDTNGSGIGFCEMRYTSTSYAAACKFDQTNTYIGAQIVLLTDPMTAVTATVKRVTCRILNNWNNSKFQDTAFLEFETPVDVPTTNIYDPNAHLLDGHLYLREIGFFSEQTNFFDDGWVTGSTNNNYWLTEGISITHDTPPSNNFGNCAAIMDSGVPSGDFKMLFKGISAANAIKTGTFQFSFWIKKHSGNPDVRLNLGNNAPDSEITVPVPDNWEYRTYNLSSPNGIGLPWLIVKDDTGAIIMDDIELKQIDQQNPTAYRDNPLKLLRDELQVGMIRYVRMGGFSMEDHLRVPNKQHSCQGRIDQYPGAYTKTGGKPDLSIGEFCGVAKEVGAIPWICVSGTLRYDEMDLLVEYLSGPTNTYGGSIRAEQGQITPWSEELDTIFIQFGNETWNLFAPYVAQGFNGANYWEDLISKAKSNPHYTNNVTFSAGGQSFSTTMAESILGHTTNADYYNIGTYTWSRFYDSDAAILNTDEKFFQWVMSNNKWVLDTKLSNQFEVSKNTGVEFTWYEYNYHTTHGVSAENYTNYVNRFLTSMAHGISIGNYSLASLKKYGTRNQCLFTLAFPGDPDAQLWGSMMDINGDDPVYTPLCLAMKISNKVRSGTMLDTVHSGNPTLSSYGRYGKNETDLMTNYFESIYSYMFQINDKTSGIVLVNYDLTSSLDVKLMLTEYVKDNTAESWLLASDSYTNDNDNASAQQVAITNFTVNSFSSGYEVTLPPCSMQVFRWEKLTDYPYLNVSDSEIDVPEGGTNVFNVKLTAMPLAAFTVSVARISGDTNLTVQSGSPAVLDASNWETGLPITLAASEDPDSQHGIAIFRCSSPGLNDADVTATEVENDLGIIALPTSISVPENGSEIFDVKLSTDPGGAFAVTVTRDSGDTDIAPSPDPTVLNFNSGNWNDYQTVTVNAGDDPDVGNNKAILSCAGPGVDTNYITCTEIDDDTVELIVSPLSIEVAEGGTNGFTVKMSVIPPENSTVTVSRVSGSTDLIVTNGGTIVFGAANWDVEQLVTIAAKEDPDYRNGTAVFRCEPLFPNTEGPVDVSAKSIDNDVTNVSFQVGVSPAGYSTDDMDDTCLDDWRKTHCYGDDASVELVSGNIKKAPVRWDLTSIPTTARVVTATLTFTINDNNTSEFEGVLYELKRSWVEGTTDGTGADWKTYDGANPWQVAGAEGTNDVGDIVLGSAVFDTLTVNIELNSAGVKCVNNWIQNPGENHGFLLAKGGPSWPRDSAQIKTSEASTPADRPKLSLGYYYSDGSAPTNASVIINNGELETTNFVVELTLFAENPTPIDMQISELSDFSDASWIDYQTNYVWTFGAPYGEKTVYARFADGGAGISETASDSINIIPEISVVGSLWSVVGMVLLGFRKSK